MTAMQGRLDASQELKDSGREEGRANQLYSTHLNLLYCYSASCPNLTDDDDSGMSNVHTCIHVCV